MDTVGIIGAMELEIKLLKEKMYIERKETIAGFNYYIGRIEEKNVIVTCCGVGSGESFISNSEMKKSIIEEYSPYCVEMEGAAIGHVSYINNIPFVVIRCISDNADDEADINYNDFEKISAEHSANIVFNMMKIID